MPKQPVQKPSQEVLLASWPVNSSNFDPTIDTSHRASTTLIRVQTKHQARWWLTVQAIWWRSLMKLSSTIHHFRFPQPPKPTFIRKFNVSSIPYPEIRLLFYCPIDYEAQRQKGKIYPIVVDFHGGGFALGTAFDDRYYARVILEEMDAVFVSVDYRLAPTHPFPSAVDDGVDTLLYLAANAEELSLNTSKIALTGFSAGANLSFTVPLRYQFHALSSEGTLCRYESGAHLLNGTSDIQVVSIVAWYPIVDYAASREDRRAMSIRPDKCLPKFFTNLFDQSYLPQGSDKTSPYVSPLLAQDSMLVNGYPDDIGLFVCEWDMLYAEGLKFSERLSELGKDVKETIVYQRPHGWDQSPNPFRNQKEIDEYYRTAAAQMRAAFEEK